jgi:hypothetical protein
MQGFLQRAYGLVQKLQPQAPAIRLGDNANRDWLPPVIGPSDWSYGMMQTVADSSSAWYFDRR